MAGWHFVLAHCRACSMPQSGCPATISASKHRSCLCFCVFFVFPRAFTACPPGLCAGAPQPEAGAPKAWAHESGHATDAGQGQRVLDTDVTSCIKCNYKQRKVMFLLPAPPRGCLMASSICVPGTSRHMCRHCICICRRWLTFRLRRHQHSGMSRRLHCMCRRWWAFKLRRRLRKQLCTMQPIVDTTC